MFYINVFAIYVDGLLQKLQSSAIGCYDNHTFVGATAYADDLILLAPIVTTLRKVINICELYAAQYDIKLNSSKNIYMHYIGRECNVFNTDIFVDGDKVEQVTFADHLGHKVTAINKNSIVNAAQSQVWRSFNLFMVNVGHSYGICPSMKYACL